MTAELRLLDCSQGRWECVAVAPSYESFANPGVSSQSKLIPAKRIDTVALLKAANRQLLGDYVQVVAVDMPLSGSSILARRVADNLISKVFGRFGCSTHSPTAARPGAVSDRLRNGFATEGFVLHTASRCTRPGLSLIETFPHPALLALCECDYRVPYKVSKARRYWPTASRSEIRVNLKLQMQRILEALRKDIDKIPIDIEMAPDDSSVRELKAFEDMIDALVCAWVGIKYSSGHAEAYGDSTAAIWIPKIPALEASIRADVD